jgi:hypothetical protein
MIMSLASLMMVRFGGHSRLHGYIVFMAVVRYLFSMPYRRIEGFTRDLHRFVPRLPTIDYSWVRRSILRFDLSLYEPIRGITGYGRRWLLKQRSNPLYGENSMAINIINLQN